VVPEPGGRVEAVERKRAVAVAGEQVDGVDEVVADGVGDEVVEVDPDSAGFDAFAAEAEFAFEGV
jgi:hypothetical protein